MRMRFIIRILPNGNMRIWDRHNAAWRGKASTSWVTLNDRLDKLNHPIPRRGR